MFCWRGNLTWPKELGGPPGTMTLKDAQELAKWGGRLGKEGTVVQVHLQDVGRPGDKACMD